jgi:hypothetical protein
MASYDIVNVNRVGTNATKVTDLYVSNINGVAYSAGGAGWVGTATSNLNMGSYTSYSPFIRLQADDSDLVNQKYGIKFFSHHAYAMYFGHANSAGASTGSMNNLPLVQFNGMNEAIRIRVFSNGDTNNYRGFIIENSNDNWTASQTSLEYSGLYQIDAEYGNSWTKGNGSFGGLISRGTTTLTPLASNNFTLKINSSGVVYAENVASSRRYKENIVSISERQSADLLKLEVHQAKYINHCTDSSYLKPKPICCLIAEEVEEDNGLDESTKQTLVVKNKSLDTGRVDENGDAIYEYQVEAIDYNSLTCMLLKLVQTQSAQLESLKRRIVSLEKRR